MRAGEGKITNEGTQQDPRSGGAGEGEEPFSNKMNQRFQLSPSQNLKIIRRESSDPREMEHHPRLIVT